MKKSNFADNKIQFPGPMPSISKFSPQSSNPSPSPSTFTMENFLCNNLGGSPLQQYVQSSPVQDAQTYQFSNNMFYGEDESPLIQLNIPNLSGIQQQSQLDLQFQHQNIPNEPPFGIADENDEQTLSNLLDLGDKMITDSSELMSYLSIK